MTMLLFHNPLYFKQRSRLSFLVHLLLQPAAVPNKANAAELLPFRF